MVVPGFALGVKQSAIAPGSVGIFWMGQSGFVLRGQDVTLMIDPFLSEFPGRLHPPVDRPEAFDFVDGVLATHEHEDHMDLTSWPTLAGTSPDARFAVPRPLAGRVVGSGIPEDRVIAAEPETEFSVGAARVTPLPSVHGVEPADAYGFGRERSGGLVRYLGYVVELGGVRVYHPGDTLLYDGLADRLRRLRINVALLPINGRDYYREKQGLVGNLALREAADLAADIGVDLVVPTHYELMEGNTERVGAFVDYLQQNHPQVSTMVPGRYVGFVYAPMGMSQRF